MIKAEYRMDEKTFSTILDHLFDGVYYVDRTKTITYWNKSAERITGYSKEEVLGKRCADNLLRHIDKEGRELCVDGCPLTETLIDGKTRSNEVFLHHKAGHRVPVSIRVSPIRDDNHMIAGAIEIFSDLSSRSDIIKEFERLKHEVYTDALTEIGNRKFAELNLERQSQDFRTTGIPFAVLFLDIDHFKNFNDTYGHQIGDLILKMMAKTVSNTLRKMDIICRWGGEEFLVIVPHIEIENLKKVAERIRAMIEKSWIEVVSQSLCITASIGGSLIKKDDTIESLIHRADQMMYTSKNKGRNRVTLG